MASFGFLTLTWIIVARAMKSTSKHSSPGKDSVPAAHAAEQAERCRRLAQATFDRKTSEMLDRMAEDYERQAKAGRH